MKPRFDPSGDPDDSRDGFGDSAAGSRTLCPVRGRDQLNLDQAIARAAPAGTLVRHEAVSVFLEVLRLAAESQVAPDAASILLEEDGTLTPAQAPASQGRDAAEPIRAACRLATRLFGAAKVEPPLALAGAAETAPERFPTLRHLRDAFELELLLSGTPAPTEAERRMAIAALMAKARQLRGTSAGPRPVRPQALPALVDPSTRDTEPPVRVARRAPPRWVAIAAAAGLGLATGFLLDHDRSGRSPAAPAPSPAVLAAEIALPPPDVRPPAVSDSRVAPREHVAPVVAAPSSDTAPRPSRKLRRRAAVVAVADAGSAARAKLQLGDESLKQGRFFEALMAFREALDQDPPLPAAARRLGDAYRAHQDTELAVGAYERYLELEPSAPDAEEVRATVEQLRSSTSLAR